MDKKHRVSQLWTMKLFQAVKRQAQREDKTITDFTMDTIKKELIRCGDLGNWNWKKPGGKK